MNKTTLFTIFMSALIIVVMGELWVNKYLLSPMAQQLKTDVLESADPAGESVHGAATVAESAPVLSAAETVNSYPLLTFELIQKAGFNQVTLQRIPFAENLFGRVAVKNGIAWQVFAHNLLKNNSAVVATLWEFQNKSPTLALDVYRLLRQKFALQSGAVINATNDFGENSFYINYADDQTNAFLVVKKGSNVYASTYRKDLHSSIQALLTLLP